MCSTANYGKLLKKIPQNSSSNPIQSSTFIYLLLQESDSHISSLTETAPECFPCVC